MIQHGLAILFPPTLSVHHEANHDFSISRSPSVRKHCYRMPANLAASNTARALSTNDEVRLAFVRVGPRGGEIAPPGF
jgi:hypothetical protein